MRVPVLSGLFLMLVTPIFAQPIHGTLVGERDGDTLNYECREVSADMIECDFVQVLMSKDALEPITEDALNLVLADMMTEGTSAICENVGNTISVLEGADGQAVWPEKSEEEVETIKSSVRSAPNGLAGLTALHNLCENPTTQNAARLLEITNQSRDIVCKPFVNKYSQTFVRVSPKTWVVKSEPSGPCGIVNTSKFIGHPEFEILWSYYASKVVTNKEGKNLIDCSELDEREQPYKWDQGPVHKNCQYFD